MPRLQERPVQQRNQFDSFPASTGQDSCRRAAKIVDIDHPTVLYLILTGIVLIVLGVMFRHPLTRFSGHIFSKKHKRKET